MPVLPARLILKTLLVQKVKMDTKAVDEEFLPLSVVERKRVSCMRFFLGILQSVSLLKQIISFSLFILIYSQASGSYT